ncbi:MAG: hypothetical protein K1X74_06820 [Pirellulales bacterium]|nr:hypothetical protein [Pirellulales bacterium]
MVHAHVCVLVADEDELARGVSEPALREVAPWTDPLISQLLVGRGWRLPLADMLARYEDTPGEPVVVDPTRCELRSDEPRLRRDWDRA